MDDVRKIKAIKAIANTEFTPEIEDTTTSGYSKYAFSDIATLGTGWAAFASEFQKAVSASKGMSGLYYVDVPETGQLFSRKNGTGYLGSVKSADGTVGGGQASLLPAGVDPVTIAVAVALMNVERKLGDIQEVQEEMKDFLEKRERSKQQGDLLFMSDILNNFKYNWDNEEYKRSNHIKVLDVRQSAEQNIIFYRSLVEKHLGKAGFIQLGPDVNRRIEKQVELLNDYQLSVYLYAMASFLDVVLVDNYANDYLSAVVAKIEDYSYNYRMLYSRVFDQLDAEIDKSVLGLALKGLEKTGKGLGSVAEKMPVVSKTGVEGILSDTGEHIGEFGDHRKEDALKQLVLKKSGNVKPFVDNLNLLNELYNQPVEVLVDKDNLYIAAG